MLKRFLNRASGGDDVHGDERDTNVDVVSSAGSVNAAAAAHVQQQHDEPAFLILSTFCDSHGVPVKPQGLEWNMSARSHLVYVANPGGPANIDPPLSPDSPQVRRWLVAAHNLWCFAKGLRYVTEEEIEEVIVVDAGGGGRGGGAGSDVLAGTNLGTSNNNSSTRLAVRWADPSRRRGRETETYDPDDIIDAIRRDRSAAAPGEPAQVWINGVLIGVLDGPETVDSVVGAVREWRSVRRVMYRSSGWPHCLQKLAHFAWFSRSAHTPTHSHTSSCTRTTRTIAHSTSHAAKRVTHALFNFVASSQLLATCSPHID